ncbi:dynein regulatory complex protein 8 isoform X1 [Nothobranchius furzeri]|uniref:EF-hand calcium binding domain 2 n=2 Tax=Nothobranchius furzeri TaxID=105023 RepID=A0A8C6NMM8_NOTFU|nr:dynein regulatory complex protein 8 isoform X1 [Nothobranchius furzeri]
MCLTLLIYLVGLFFSETVSDIHKKITTAFKLFDYDANNTVDAREISTIVFSLGCFPSQADLHQIIAEVEEGSSGYVHLDTFLPVMTKVLLEHRFPPIPVEHILRAFEVLDKENKGHLEEGELTKYMTEEGEPFTNKEMEEMLAVLLNNKRGLVYYRDAVGLLGFDGVMK